VSCRPRPSGRKRPGHTLPEAARRIVALVAESTSGAHRIVEFIGVADGIARQKSSLHAAHHVQHSPPHTFPALSGHDAAWCTV